MKHIMNFPELTALLVATLLSVFSISAQALEPITLFSSPISSPRFDIVALNDWRASVAEGRTSDQELALSFYQILQSMEFSLTGAPSFRGNLNAHESRIMLKTLRIALEHIENSFPVALFSFGTALMERQFSLLNTLTCVWREGDYYLVKIPHMSRCGEEFGHFQALASKEDERQAIESVLVFHRLGKFLQSFEKGESVLPFLEAYTRTPDGVYCLAFIKKYMKNTRYVSEKDRTDYIGFLGNF